MTPQQVVTKLWSYCHVLRDTGVGTLDYIEQLTFLLFLKMADEQYRLTGTRVVPEGQDWASLLVLDGDELEIHYRKPPGSRLPGERRGALGFIKAREWDYGLAVLLCPHKCGSSPVGAQKLRGVVAKSGPYPRDESVESAFGGYGLCYRSPMAEVGVVARAGTMLGDAPIPIDVLYDTARATNLVKSFREAVKDTAYVKAWMLTSEPLPKDELVEYAKVACLCQLRHRAVERDAVHEALLGDSSPGTATAPAGPGP